MMNFSRLKKHLFTTAGASHETFPRLTLKAIEAAITDGELRHRAEVRLIIEHALPLKEILQGISARQRAMDLFARYRVWDTEENCGVLVYINLADRKVEIVADRAVARLIVQEEWDAVCQTMTEGFAREAFRDSTIAAIAQLNALLAEHYPARGAHPNQLANQPILL